MKQISELVTQLHQRLQDVARPEPGWDRVELPLSFTARSLLGWLSAQSLFPQFYWRQRDGREEFAVCGEVVRFHDARAAYRFLVQSERSDMRVWGLNAFDRVDASETAVPKGALFLPRIELLRDELGVRLAVNLYSESSLADDVKRAQQTLASLVSSKPLASLSAAVLDVHHQPEKEGWCSLLRQALSTIAAKQFDKVVLARRSTLTLSKPLNPAAFLNASQKVNHRCFHFMMRMNDETAFLGSSPECLFLREGNRLTTEALAGTVAGSPDDEKAKALGEWLMQDKKNQHENLLVVDDICQRLQGGTEAIDVLPAEIVRLRKVQHLKRAIHAQLADVDDADTLQRLQPTAAVAGLPREAARQFIVQNEPFTRGWYAGSAGYLSLGRSEFAVSLRSALIEDDKIHLYAGAGIVAGSDPEEEWLEIENKAAGLRTLLEQEE
ncbi:menaquinone-specific isochorismate synthase [Leminorella grimontii]|uniref:Isochorismate synthase MenF n=1 Tax=Leminorella grimontii TaxID=82981 RepID=A0AAV5N1G7_9GAMM|nr:isochorismate synthase MenF [Leminorella grimontii]KFC96819.1 menaquinone-specific isochorismate synthase [Leminorella grimontii ATCC 33999 = DSM 5078]GKX55965.1 menaquinone-specific isochorismate synthase [Leminorella grimontii]